MLEVNSIPGLTDTSLLPMAAEAAGISFERFVERAPGSGDRQESRLVSEAPGEIEVRDIRAGEEGAAAAVLGRGMRDNPLHFAAYGADPDRRERIHTRVSSFVLEKMSAQEPIVAVDDGGSSGSPARWRSVAASRTSPSR